MGQPTMEDVAARAGVSRALVSLVMRDSPKVSAKSRAAVLEAAEELGYRPNLMARHLASRKSMTLGLLLNDLHNPFFAEITDGIFDAATAAGYRIMINTGLRSTEGERASVDTFLQFRVDGIVLVGPWLADDELIELAQETPLVVVGRQLDDNRIDTVNTDDRLGAEMVIQHLVDLGHERIAHIDGGVGAGANARREGYVTAMRASGLASNVRIIPGSFTEAAGNEGVDRLLREAELPTAVFAGNDLMATGALDRLESEGLTVPGDVSLVGFDNTALAALGQIGLTTVNQPRHTLGELAAAALIERIEGKRSSAVHKVLAPSLVPRTTTAPPRANVPS
ncbi:MAG: LacI family DNA-binding transcriptional regulator [Acidimicrobiales bacterium]